MSLLAVAESTVHSLATSPSSKNVAKCAELLSRFQVTIHSVGNKSMAIVFIVSHEHGAHLYYDLHHSAESTAMRNGMAQARMTGNTDASLFS